LEGKDEEEDWERRVWKSEGKNLSQTASDAAADRKVDETRESLHASLGDVKERIVAMQPSGRLLNSSAIAIRKNENDRDDNGYIYIYIYIYIYMLCV